MRIIAVWSLFARWTLRVTENKGVFASRLIKIRADQREVWRFFQPKGKEYPVPARSSPRANTLWTPLIISMKVEPAQPRRVTLNDRHTKMLSLTTMWRCNDLWKELWSGREEHGLPIRVARGTATSPAHPHAALRLPVFSPLSLCRVRSMGVRRSPSPFDGTQPNTAKRCTSASFRREKNIEPSNT